MVPADLLRQVIRPFCFTAGELADLARAMGTPPPVAIRLRAAESAASLPFRTAFVPWHPRCCLVQDSVRPGSYLSYAAGEYYIQDAGSLLALALAAVQPGERVCDLCASPGGKSTALLEDLGGAGWLLANEPIHGRLAPLLFNLARHGTTRFALSGLDPERLAAQLRSLFDLVVADVPCSGQSLVARGKQTSAAFQRATIEHCAARQTRILDAAARLVRPGGRLIYSTCTYSREENEDQIVRFLGDRADWTLQQAPGLQAWESPLLPGSYRLWPHRDLCGGAFAAALRRQGGDAEGEPASRRSTPPALVVPSRKLGAEVPWSDWGELGNVFLLGSSQRLFAWPEPLWEPLRTVAVHGPEVAFRKHVTWFPSYALALRRDPGWQPVRTVELDDPAAAAFTQGLAVRMAIPGWAVATWCGKPLGWLKGDGRQGKNHLPKPARLNQVLAG